ncbi:MAG: hypothetical protein V4662_26770 [Verrucomicrobiota bacterium]
MTALSYDHIPRVFALATGMPRYLAGAESFPGAGVLGAAHATCEQGQLD